MIQDSVVVVSHVVTDSVSPVATILIGAAATAVTGLVKLGLSTTDKELRPVDQAITKGLGPVWPLVTAGLAAALPLISNATGITDLPTAAVIAASPASAFAGIVIRESVKKLVGLFK